MSIDWIALEQAGVYDPNSAMARERRELLEYFETMGASTEAILDAAGEGELLTVAADLHSTAGEVFNVSELAERAEFPLHVVEELYSVLGLPVNDPTERLFTEADVEFLCGMAAGPASMFRVSEMAEMLRVFGTSLARISDAAVSTFMQGVERRLVEIGASEVDVAKNSVAAMHQAEHLPDLLSVLLRHHFRASIRRLRDAAVAAGGHGFRMAVGFVDVVGFTPLSASLAPGELAELVAGFENRTSDVITRCGGTVVKHLGDEVMFMAVDPAIACEIVLELVDDFADQGMQPHAGLTFGDAVTRRGDYYGPNVNLAARLVNHAVPGEVLINDELVEAVTDDPRYKFTPGGRRMVRGFDDPVSVWSLESA